MNPYLRLDGVELWYVAGWTMVHYLWLGALVGIAAAGCRLILRRASPNVSYVAAAVSLAVLTVLPLAIAGWLVVNPPPFQGGERGGFISASDNPRKARSLRDVTVGTESVAEFDVHSAELSREAVILHTDFEAIESTAEPSPSPSLTGRRILVGAIESCVGYLPWIWFLGTPLTLALLGTGIVGTQRLRRASQPITSGPLTVMSERLSKSLRVGRRAVIAICDRVCAPVLVGIVRPMILLPPAALTGWTPDEIEMVLLHELAHVRRWDNLVNLLQRLVESLLFFHPAVWVVSSWMRRDREACCDAIVVACTSRPHAYAELLVALAAQMPRSVLFHPAASSALTEGPLRNRIRRILQLEDDSMLVTEKSFALVLAGLLTAATLTVLYLPTRGQAEESATEATEITERAAGPTIDDDAQSANQTANDVDDESQGAAPTVTVGYDNPSNAAQGASQQEPQDDHDDELNEPGEDDAESPEARVLGTFSLDSDADDQQELLRAIDEARSQNLYVDIEYGEDKLKLIVARAPRAADWPAMLGDPPRKERVIADKAWERLGLKVVPASSLEQYDFHTRRQAGPVKILGGNVPKGLPLPAYLRQVGGNSLESVDDLHEWLLNEEDEKPEPVKVYTFANGHEYLFDAGPIDVDEAAPAQGPKSKFPSLEDQKLADLAWRMLQLELEPAGKDELKHVRALGYQGGVTVSGTARSDGRRASYNEIQPGDILVGLHVWPTTSLNDVATILTRDDLVDLNPLKFYVVRAEDVVVTGRITIRSRSAQPSGLSQLDAAERGSKNSAASAGDLSEYVRRSGDKPPAAASESEIKVLQEHIETLQSQFDRIDALFKAGRRGGHASTRALAGYELAVAKGELALMQRQHDRAIKSFYEAQSQAEEAFKAMSADYEAGNTTYDVTLLTAKNLADIKRKIIQLQQQRTVSNRAATATSAARHATSTKAPEAGGDDPGPVTSAAPDPNQTSSANKRHGAGVSIAAESQEALDEFMRLASRPQLGESMSVLRKIVEREKQKLDHLVELAQNGKVPAAEAETQKANFEISIQRLRQAERALEYHRALVQLAAAEYEAALEASKKAPGAVSESELRKLQLKVQLAEAKYKELAE